jgi:hypothetical protein
MPEVFYYILRIKNMDEKDKMTILYKVDFANFPNNLLNNSFQNLLSYQTPNLQKHIKANLTFFKPNFKQEMNEKDKDCSIQ